MERFAGRLQSAGLEITLAVYIDAVALRSPTVPANSSSKAGVLMTLDVAALDLEVVAP